MGIVERSKGLLLRVGAAPVMYLMIGLSVVALAIVLERLRAFRRTHDDLEALAADVERALRAGDFGAAAERARRSPSVEGRVAWAGLRQADRGREAAERAMAGALGLQRSGLEARLVYLNTLGNNAPFVGLFGTVVGVVMAFEQLSRGGQGVGASTASSEVMASIAEALVSTAIGLLVAIPAVVAYNYFQRRIKATVARADALAGLVAALLPAHAAARPPATAPPGAAAEPSPSPPAGLAAATAAPGGA